MEGLKGKAYEKLGDNVAGNLKQKGHNLKETLRYTKWSTFLNVKVKLIVILKNVLLKWLKKKCRIKDYFGECSVR